MRYLVSYDFIAPNLFQISRFFASQKKKRPPGRQSAKNLDFGTNLSQRLCAVNSAPLEG
jgi:hypothetical protein